MPPRKVAKTPASSRKRAVSKKKTHETPFDQRLVLCQWMFGLFGASHLKELTDGSDWERYEGFTEEGQTAFLPLLTNNNQKAPFLSSEMLGEYDRNIVRHWREITENRLEHGIRPTPKYFQYLALLFTEIYLHRWMDDAESLRVSLNKKIEAFNKASGRDNPLPEYELDDLRKLAFWSATGSGKTLLMHVNIKQYHHYLRKYGRERELNKTILLTPNERLSTQHVDEFELSNMNGELFQKGAASLFQADRIEVIDINKLREESKQKTIDVQAFEGNNLLLVDEGHRGTAAESSVWMGYRAQLCSQGFSFEYSATFGQAMRATNRPDLPRQYAKCIVFDYSYKHFYRDGYGKQYQIFNLKEWIEENRELYLTACLLAFYQQLRTFSDFRDQLRPYNIEKPLWVFVAARVSPTPGKAEISDVVSILLYLARFLASDNRKTVLDRIEKLVSGNAALLDPHGRQLFKNAFSYLARLQLSPDAIFQDILALLFNTAQASPLQVNWLKGTEGELALQVGESKPFGVINVGEPTNLFKACRQVLNAGELVVSDSLFSGINSERSTINLLIGAKKFNEGWNSFRVSTLGLMNVGKSEGSQIIQLFGRGIRLWGRGFSLKRSAHRPGTPECLDVVERLYVFGLSAQYMDKFREFLEQEGVPPETIELTIPIVTRKWPERLRVLRVENFDFKKDGVKPTLDSWPDKKPDPVRLDWYPRVFELAAKGQESRAREGHKNEAKLKEEHLAFADMDRIYFELQRFKSEKGWPNLNLPKDRMTKLLRDASWYTLYIPLNILEFRDFKQVRIWEQIAVALLKKYCEKFYHYRRAEAEAPHMKYVELTEDSTNFIEDDQYLVRLDEREETLQTHIESLRETILRLRDAIRDGNFSKIDLALFGQDFKPIFFAQHLYHPLIAASDVKVRPVALNPGELQFVEDLRTFYQQQKAKYLVGAELYLLRNRSRGRGIGFFEAGNFYPDFILWVLKADVQYITFVDPKGIRNEPGLYAPKLHFHKTIKEKQDSLKATDIVLNSFILSRTPVTDVSHWEGGVTQSDLEDRNVLFLGDGGPAYLPKMFARMLSSSVPI